MKVKTGKKQFVSIFLPSESYWYIGGREERERRVRSKERERTLIPLINWQRRDGQGWKDLKFRKNPPDPSDHFLKDDIPYFQHTLNITVVLGIIC